MTYFVPDIPKAQNLTCAAVAPLLEDYYVRNFIKQYGMPRACEHPRQKFVGDGWKCVDCGQRFE